MTYTPIYYVAPCKKLIVYDSDLYMTSRQRIQIWVKLKQNIPLYIIKREDSVERWLIMRKLWVYADVT